MEEQKKKEQVDFDKLVQKARSLGITVNEHDLLFCDKLTISRMIADEIEYLEERLRECKKCWTVKIKRKEYIDDIGRKYFLCESCKEKVEKELEERYNFPVRLRSMEYYAEREMKRRWK